MILSGLLDFLRKKLQKTDGNRKASFKSPAKNYYPIRKGIAVMLCKLA